MDVQLVRHATLVLHVKGRKLLVDPMLGDVGVAPPIQNSANDKRNPLVPLPVSIEELLQADAVLVTHTHRDHFDEAAAERLPKHLPLFCQPQDEQKLKDLHFQHVTPVDRSVEWEGIEIIRTSGRHGVGEIGEKMGPVSGFVVRANGEPSLYIAGDTIWCSEVEQALQAEHPDIVLVNAGAAQFKTGKPITMTADDVIEVCKAAPHSKVVAVHVESINHCLQTRDDLRSVLADAHLLDQVQIPSDGETLHFE